MPRIDGAVASSSMVSTRLDSSTRRLAILLFGLVPFALVVVATLVSALRPDGWHRVPAELLLECLLVTGAQVLGFACAQALMPRRVRAPRSRYLLLSTCLGVLCTIPGAAMLDDPGHNLATVLAVSAALSAYLSATGLALAFFLADQRPRSRRAVCRVCGYDLRATPERCPECGAEPGAEARTMP